MPNQYMNDHKEVPCANCGKLIKVSLSRHKRNKFCCCSLMCRDENRHKVKLAEIDFIKTSFSTIGMEGLMLRYNCNRECVRKRLQAYRAIDKEVPFATRSIVYIVKEKKNKPVNKPAKKKPPRHKIPPKPVVKKFERRAEDMTGKRFVKINSKTWALRPILKTA